ncbi:hypothetical protein BD626DRAFT_538846 [Schizophyllum amplum]|uniref:N-acetyltransferase domain-containing protein n=1 Tax=Schizophyllum amplum TaxID=97359 RepID=A0A550C6L5_9AGAR|nr:hypothetical protein BD626DRAFT_538846 [Auriculariopsis ampla]
MPAPKSTPTILLSDRLVGQDDRLDALFTLWETAQLSCADIAARPNADLISFAHDAAYFAVVDVKEEESKPVAPKAPSVSSAQSKKYPWASAFSAAPNLSSNSLPSPGAQKASSSTWEEHTQYLPPEQAEATQRAFPLRKQNAEPVANKILLDNRTANDALLASYHAQEQTVLAHDATDDNTETSFQPAADYSFNAITAADYSPADSTWPETRPYGAPAGFVYLVRAKAEGLVRAEAASILNIGLVLAPDYRHRGLGQLVLAAVLPQAFDKMSAHRVQAFVLGAGIEKHRALGLFTKAGFAHEGTQRAAFWSPLEAQWRDETTTAMLATDWVMRPVADKLRRGAPPGIWEELFARHAREREELLRWEQTYSHTVRRTSSTETIRMINDGAPSEASSREASPAHSRAPSPPSTRDVSVEPSMSSAAAAREAMDIDGLDSSEDEWSALETSSASSYDMMSDDGR